MFGLPILRKLNLSKTSFYSLFLFSLISCSDLDKKKSEQIIQGNTQGTTYNIKIPSSSNKVNKATINQLLKSFDDILSNYNPLSLISKLNQSNTDTIFTDESNYFINCYKKSQKIFNETNGAFDPSVLPLVKKWGLFYNKTSEIPDSSEIDSILNFTSFKSNYLHNFKVISDKQFYYKKKDKRFNIDFNAIAQGYAVDVIANYLDKLNIKNYFVEIGGEIIVKGKKSNNKKWKIGIDSPIENNNKRTLQCVLSISNKAIATSGNYRKFYIKNGKKYAHTIDPKTGIPVTHNLLSATVIADNCADADAYATAFMVMGLNESISFIENNPKLNLETYLIYQNSKGNLAVYSSDGMSKYIENK